MALFARIDRKTAEMLLMESWPEHHWCERSLYFLLNEPKNKAHIPNIPLNPGLLESVKKHGYVSPFLVINNWYPICGGQRLRVAMELPVKFQKQTMVKVCRFTKDTWRPYYHWHNQQEGHKAVQMWFQMCEVVFKTLYMGDADPSGKRLLDFEEEGNLLHWPHRDSVPKGNAAAAPPFQKKKMQIPKA